MFVIWYQTISYTMWSASHKRILLSFMEVFLWRFSLTQVSIIQWKMTWNRNYTTNRTSPEQRLHKSNICNRCVDVNKLFWVLKRQSTMYQPASRSSWWGVKWESEAAWQPLRIQEPSSPHLPHPHSLILTIVIFPILGEVLYQCNLKTSLLASPPPSN